jgi:histidinol phosphatase-like enzyme (inositol monophosphatase family)
MTVRSAVSVDDVRSLLTYAIELATRAGAVTLEHFGKVHSGDSKADGTPVTIADREAETLLRTGIRRRFPDHSILGEEFGEDPGTVPVRWIVDPIDGTHSFMRGVPLYAVLIGVEMEGEAVVGVAHLPALAETVSAGRGLGCRWTVGTVTRDARVSGTEDVHEALALTSDPAATLGSPIASGWKELCGQVRVVRGWGDAYGHVLVATGRAEIMVDPVLSPWDAAALLPILVEAGGRFTDLEGRVTIHGGSGVSSNGRIHERALQILKGR